MYIFSTFDIKIRFVIGTSIYKYALLIVLWLFTMHYNIGRTYTIRVYCYIAQSKYWERHLIWIMILSKKNFFSWINIAYILHKQFIRLFIRVSDMLLQLKVNDDGCSKGERCFCPITTEGSSTKSVRALCIIPPSRCVLFFLQKPKPLPGGIKRRAPINLLRVNWNTKYVSSCYLESPVICQTLQHIW